MTTTIEDIQAVGFVPLQYWGFEQRNPLGKQGLHTSKNLLVHETALEWCTHHGHDQIEHPTIRYNISGESKEQRGKKVTTLFGGPSGWEAKWGAMYFDINTPFRLIQFCKQFKYPVSIETEMALLNLYPDDKDFTH